MTAELVLLQSDVDGAMINPRTGDVISAESGDKVLVDFIRFLREARDMIGTADREVQRILIDRMDHRRAWTLFGASAPSPTAGGEWNDLLLEPVLAKMVEDGVLDQEAMTACFRLKREVVSKAINAVLAGSTPEDQDAILRCRDAPTRTRSVRV